MSGQLSVSKCTYAVHALVCTRVELTLLMIRFYNVVTRVSPNHALIGLFVGGQLGFRNGLLLGNLVF